MNHFKKYAKDENENLYILKFREKMLPGDIILTKSNTKNSIFIRKITAGDFSHAILYLGDSYMHSDLQGVHSGNPQRMLFQDPTHVKILRLKDRSFYAEEIEKICAYARKLHGMEYSKREASKSVLRPIVFVNLNRQFCSRLVAQSYASVGLHLVESINFCTPNDLARSTLLQEIFEVVEIANQNQIDFANSKNILEKQIDIVNSLLKEVRKVSKFDIQTLNDIDLFLIRHPDFDESFTQILLQSGYLDIWEYDYNKNQYRYNKEAFLDTTSEKFIQQYNEAKDKYGDELSIEQFQYIRAYSELSRFTGESAATNEGIRFNTNLLGYTKNHDYYNLQYFFHMKKLYETLTQNCRTNLNIAKEMHELFSKKLERM